MPGLNNGFSVVAGGPRNDCMACRANDDEPPWEFELPAPLPCRMLESGELAPVKTESGPELAGVLASSSSPKKLLMADMAGLKPAMANGVSKSDGINGAENSRPRLNGFDRRPDAKPACLSMLGFLVKNGA